MNPVIFETRQEAKDWILSPEYDIVTNDLQREVASLIEKAKTEPWSKGFLSHPDFKESEEIAMYVQSDLDRLQTLKRYFTGSLPLPGYKWIYEDSCNGRAYEQLDLDNVDQSHPVFKDYLIHHSVPVDCIDEAFELWLKMVSPTSTISDLFKGTYNWVAKGIFPDGVMLKR